MGHTVQVRNVTIGSGIPKICVPLMSSTVSGLKNVTKEAAAHGPDLVEWRADSLDSLTEADSVREALLLLRELLGEIPLLFTVRTCREGGRAALTPEEYRRVLSDAMDAGGMDLIDVEIAQGEDLACCLIRQAQECGCRALASCHHFHHTPRKEEILMTLCKMQEMGADIVKMAVMPEKERDVLTLLDATLAMKELHRKTPVITMSMGAMGEISRFTGALFGSDVTFGTVGEASAPGQPAMELLRELLTHLPA